MNLIETDEPKRPLEQNTEQGYTWPQLIAVILAALILIALIVLLARWIYHKAHEDDKKVTTNPAPLQLATPNTNKNNANQAVPANPPPPATPPSASNPTPSNNIPNNGPGDVAAMFAGASLAAAGLHYIVSLRRFNRAKD